MSNQHGIFNYVLICNTTFCEVFYIYTIPHDSQACAAPPLTLWRGMEQGHRTENGNSLETAAQVAQFAFPSCS